MDACSLSLFPSHESRDLSLFDVRFVLFDRDRSRPRLVASSGFVIPSKVSTKPCLRSKRCSSLRLAISSSLNPFPGIEPPSVLLRASPSPWGLPSRVSPLVLAGRAALPLAGPNPPVFPPGFWGGGSLEVVEEDDDEDPEVPDLDNLSSSSESSSPYHQSSSYSSSPSLPPPPPPSPPGCSFDFLGGSGSFFSFFSFFSFCGLV